MNQNAQVYFTVTGRKLPQLPDFYQKASIQVKSLLPAVHSTISNSRHLIIAWDSYIKRKPKFAVYQDAQLTPKFHLQMYSLSIEKAYKAVKSVGTKSYYSMIMDTF